MGRGGSTGQSLQMCGRWGEVDPQVNHSYVTHSKKDALLFSWSKERLGFLLLAPKTFGGPLSISRSGSKQGKK